MDFLKEIVKEKYKLEDDYTKLATGNKDILTRQKKL